MLGPFAVIMSALWGRLQDARRDDRGMTTEAMIITAMLAVAAIAAVTVIATAVQNKGNDIGNSIDGALAVF
jgi:Flp pilus assembly pilin Flp